MFSNLRIFALLTVHLFHLCSCSEDEQDTCDVMEFCPLPQAPTLDIIHPTSLEFEVECFSTDDIQTGTSEELDAQEPDQWRDQREVDLDDDALPYSIKVFARLNPSICESDQIFSYVYQVHSTYPKAADQEDTTAIDMNDSRIRDWATGWVAPIDYGEDVLEKWRTPEKAIGSANKGDNPEDVNHIVSLGRGGEIVMVFDPPIRNRSGYDFVVFENSNIDDLLELGALEVSSDGETFVKFDNVYLGDKKMDPHDRHSTELIGSFAGKYIKGWGTPFDLRALVNKPETMDGRIDLNDIGFVKVVDVVGNGTETDSFGNKVYDPYPTTNSAGFDLDAIGVINN